MTQAVEFPFTAAGGTIPREVTDRLAAAVRKLDGKRLVLCLKEAKRKRSLSQNAYYFGVVVAGVTAAFREAGNMVDADDVHDYLKAEVGRLTQVLVTPQGEVLRAPGSTRKLSTTEFEAYLERVRAWAAETLDLLLPLPNETIQGL